MERRLDVVGDWAVEDVQAVEEFGRARAGENVAEAKEADGAGAAELTRASDDAR